MTNENNAKVTIETTIHAPVEKVWEYWSEPDHLTKWNTPSDDWHTPSAENDLRVGGKFSSRMEAKDGSFGFDFAGVYDEVKLHDFISYTLGDGRQVEISFISQENNTKINQVFDPETENPIEMQQQGWQAILDNFKKYAEQ
ncbi:SRPBCC family protein [Psychrobacillus soli]|uniref:Polyketide cyclase n=1 Tax=Psychrobacillus soli TaxID=1543965 RepID=A0A544SQT0_9BACI|nr:SRPBCC family protein [Psychrobacillus soli]TQR07518.1 polyketide cyclase [Psychrobacillus soli]